MQLLELAIRKSPTALMPFSQRHVTPSVSITILTYGDVSAYVSVLASDVNALANK
ncbi:hypothetical protein DPMN_072113 [Dreissena polymorpha]|uniref:Uncharacterized protein n=1 Tax=Dreissena polymorpha TaxID=45954 RepID=A0A9D4BXH0_DREPO|nr:hypothetical protein DPMN_072113 [Dreissena polymorpha]